MKIIKQLKVYVNKLVNMGAEHSQQHRADIVGREVFEGSGNASTSTASSSSAAATIAYGQTNKINSETKKQRQKDKTHQTGNKATTVVIASPTTSELSRPPSPPLSICSDLPYVSYSERPIGDSPKIRNKPVSALTGSSSSRAEMRRSHPAAGAKPKRPQSSASSHNIVIVKPGTTRDNDMDIEPELARLRSIPQFLPVLRNSIASAPFTRDPEVLERLNSQHLQNICSRMQVHLNLCATQVAKDQAHLVERTKVVSNSITTLFATFVDMQKAYSAYGEQFSKIRLVSQQLAKCQTMLNENIASLEAINNFLPVEERLEPFIWRTDDNKLRAEGSANAHVVDNQLIKRL